MKDGRAKGGNLKHGMTKTKTYKTWLDMKRRCLSINGDHKKNYKDKGITVCERWKKFENFLADMGIKPNGLEIDRIDNTKGYYKENCRWVTHSENQRNKSVRNKTGFPKGVTRNGKRYRAVLYINSKPMCLGTFDTPDLAGIAYIKAHDRQFGG